MAAIFSLMPLISSPPADLAGLLSSTSRATMAAPVESPTKRIPSGPMASAPADLSSTLPVCILIPAAKERTAAQQMPAASRESLRVSTKILLSENLGQCYHIGAPLDGS